MQKVIPGSSRAAFSFIVQQWKAFAILTALPLLILLAISYFELEFTLRNLVDISRMGPESDRAMPQGVPMAILFVLLKFVPLTWLLVRLSNYWMHQNLALGLASHNELQNTVVAIFYSFVFGVIAILVYFMAVFSLFIFSGAASAGISPVYFGPLLPLVILPMAIMVYLFYRFAVALPGIATGERPHVFTDIWTLTKGESFAVPARVLLSLLAYLAITIFFSATTSTSTTAEFLKNFIAEPSRSITPEDVRNWSMRMFPFTILSTIISTVFFWFTSTLLCEAYVRFRRRGPNAT